MKKPKWELILLAAILVFAAFLRLFALGVPPLWIDESISVLASMEILEKGAPVFDSGLTYSRAIIFHYLQAFFLLFSISEFAARLVSVIAGLLTIVLGYSIGRKYTPSGGIIAALLLAVFYLEVFYSRQARFYQLFQLLFFFSLYALYKSKKDIRWLYAAIPSFLLTINTQLAGIVLAPFFIMGIIYYHRKHWYLSIIPVAAIIYHAVSIFTVTSGSQATAVQYASNYALATANMLFILILSAAGALWSFKQKKELTFIILAPAITLLAGIIFIDTFAIRYAYFFAFPLILYAALPLAYLYDHYGKGMLLPLVLLILIPSNIFFPLTYVTVLKPVTYNLYDYSAPEIEYRTIPQQLQEQMKNPDTTLISLFSPSLSVAIRKPDYVIPFSLDGRGNDSISHNNKDIYSGANLLTPADPLPARPYIVSADTFSVSKLKPFQRDLLTTLTQNCTLSHNAPDLKIYSC